MPVTPVPKGRVVGPLIILAPIGNPAGYTALSAVQQGLARWQARRLNDGAARKLHCQRLRHTRRKADG
jgi:hypothetical protein